MSEMVGRDTMTDIFYLFLVIPKSLAVCVACSLNWHFYVKNYGAEGCMTGVEVSNLSCECCYQTLRRE